MRAVRSHTPVRPFAILLTARTSHRALGGSGTRGSCDTPAGCSRGQDGRAVDERSAESTRRRTIVVNPVQCRSPSRIRDEHTFELLPARGNWCALTYFNGKEGTRTTARSVVGVRPLLADDHRGGQCVWPLYAACLHDPSPFGFQTRHPAHIASPGS